ncbi:MAG: KpsF/GutQ family sugar-phosphate isomerase [Flavobacteriales bacterium]
MNNSIIASAKEAIRLEAEALAKLGQSLDSTFLSVINTVLETKQPIIVTGIGKSGIIAQKWVATFNSTGQPAQFLHASEAIHGDLGMVQNHSVVFCLSKSGDSPEIQYLVSLLKAMNVVLVGVGANTSSYLAKASTFFIHTPMDGEACPNNLAPTVSTTLQLAVGDAIALSLMTERGFSKLDFAKFHPGGALGKKIFTTIGQVMRTEAMPQVAPNCNFRDLLIEISSKRAGATAVVENNVLLGIVTDGDIRRAVERSLNLDTLTASDLMNSAAKRIQNSALAVEGFQLMESNKISQLLVVDENGTYCGIIHLHDLLSAGIN